MNIKKQLINIKDCILYYINVIVYRKEINNINITLKKIEDNKNTIKKNDDIETRIELKIIEHNKIISELKEQKRINDENEQELLQTLSNNVMILYDIVNKNEFLTMHFNNKKKDVI